MNIKTAEAYRYTHEFLTDLILLYDIHQFHRPKW
jgi:hypothetical protein